jgi:hypothetical protein
VWGLESVYYAPVSYSRFHCRTNYIYYTVKKPVALMHNRLSPFPKFPWQLSKLDYCQPMLHQWILLWPSSWHWFTLHWATYFYSHGFSELGLLFPAPWKMLFLIIGSNFMVEKETEFCWYITNFMRNAHFYWWPRLILTVYFAVICKTDPSCVPLRKLLQSHLWLEYAFIICNSVFWTASVV